METRSIKSWIIKPCSDGISIDVRPPRRFQLDLEFISQKLTKKFRPEIISSSISILFSQDNIKLTLYQSGRMLIETRNMPQAERIVNDVLDSFPLE